MKFTSALVLFAAAALPSASAKNITVSVGQGGTTFTPDTVAAAVGDIILFQFVAGNHTVTQAPFAKPCTQAWLDDDKAPGLDTGFVPGAGANGTTPIVQVRIDTDKPIWLFCQQGKHCNTGMVMVVNPPADGSKTLAQFKSNAASAPIPGYGTFANFSATAAANNSTTGNSTTGNSTTGNSQAGGAYSPKVLSGGLAAAALLVSGLML